MSATGPRQRGFTLIELLAVMVIVGILITMAALSIGNTERYRVRNEAYDLQQLLAQLRQEAILKNLQYGLRIQSDGYEVLGLDGDEWQVIKDDKLYKPHQLDKDLHYRIDIDQPQEEDAEGSVVYILSSGEMSPFSLLITTRDKRYQFTLKADMLGHLSLEGGDHAEAQ